MCHDSGRYLDFARFGGPGNERAPLPTNQSEESALVGALSSLSRLLTTRVNPTADALGGWVRAEQRLDSQNAVDRRFALGRAWLSPGARRGAAAQLLPRGPDEAGSSGSGSFLAGPRTLFPCPARVVFRFRECGEGALRRRSELALVYSLEFRRLRDQSPSRSSEKGPPTERAPVESSRVPRGSTR